MWKEREDAIIRSIMSGNNSCGNLLQYVQEAMAGDPTKLMCFLQQSVRGTLKVCADEADQLRIDRDMISRSDEAKRQALEYIASNARAVSQAHIEAFANRTLGRI